MGRGRPGFPQLGVARGTQETNLAKIFSGTSTGLSPAMAGRSRPFNYRKILSLAVDDAPSTRPAPTTPKRERTHAIGLFGLGCSQFARHYYGNRMTLYVPQGTEMFHFPWLASPAYTFNRRLSAMKRIGLPHSGTSVSKPADGSTELFAICCALHRLHAPRHPPCALRLLDYPQQNSAEHLLSKNQVTWPKPVLEMAGIEPAASCLQSRRSPN